MLKNQAYGVSVRVNMAGKSQLQRETESSISIFDPEPFMFYMIKYGEVLGVEALINAASKDRNISYEKKCKILSHILDTEARLGVQDSSWKHCLLYLFLSGSITEDVFRE